MFTAAALYVRKNTIYRQFPDIDLYDEKRDARSFSSSLPVIAHPPCRLWGRLAHFSKADISERDLAFHAVEQVRKNGGVLEHPAFSKLWPSVGLPHPGELDLLGGFTFPILQSWFGHKCPKATWLYILGLTPSELPPIPFELGFPPGRIERSSMKVREGTPLVLAEFLYEITQRIRRAA